MGLYQGSIIEFEDGNQLEVNDANARAAIATLQNKLRAGYVVSVTPDTNAQGKEGIRITYDDNESVFLQVASKGLTFTTGEFVQYNPDGEITDNYYLHLLDEEGHDIEDFTPFALPDIASEGGLAFDTGYQDEEGFIHLTSNGLDVEGFTPFQVAGGSGSSDTYSVRMISGMTNATGGITNKPTLAYNDNVIVSATFYEKFAGTSTGGTGALVASAMQPGETTYRQFYTGSVTSDRKFDVDITSVVTAGRTTNIKLEVTGEQSQQTATLTFTVSCVDATIRIESDLTATETTNFDLLYSVTARGLNKIVYVKIDNTMYHYEDIGAGTGRRSVNIRATEFSYGSHSIDIWFETAETVSNVVHSSFIYDDKTSTLPVIAPYLEKDTITYGDTIAANYVVYTPGQETTDELLITVYSINPETGSIITYITSNQANITNNTLRRFTCNDYPESGECFIKFQSGSEDTIKVLTVNINPFESDYDMSMITDGLVYRYSAANKTNDDTDKEIYIYKYTASNGTETNIKAVSSGLNWISDGYVVDENSNERALILSGNSKHVIRLPIFSTRYTDDIGQSISLGGSPQNIGRTIEIEYKFSNVTDPTAQIIKCMNADHTGFIVTPQNTWLTSATGDAAALDDTGFITNEDAIAAAYLRDDTRVVLSFVIEPAQYAKYVDEHGVTQYLQRINLYINGEAANSFDYTENYQFNSSEFISIGDSSCITRLYAVRCYNRPLSDEEVLQNYKASRDTIAQKTEQFTRNDLLTTSGEIDYEKAKFYYPCLLITGNTDKSEYILSPMKTTTVYAGVRLTKPDNNGSFTTEFDCMDVDENGDYVSYNKVQGTTSVKFPIKNFKVYPRAFKDGEVKKVKYSIKGYNANGDPIAIPESTFCWKGDYMSSDHANTFNANLVDTLFQDTNESSDPVQGGDPRVQNAVYGFRCLLFTQDIATGEIKFYGDGCLNNDKGNTKTFGLEYDGDEGNNTHRQKWEFRDNSNPLCTFETDKLQEVPVGSNDIRALAGLEACYPDQGDLEEEGLMPNYDYIQTLFTWVCQRANYWDASDILIAKPFNYNGKTYNTEKAYRKAIFEREFEWHFNLNHATIYYLFCQFTGMSDNRAKNMFLSTKNTTVEHLKDVSGNSISINDVISADGTVDFERIDWENSTFCIWYVDPYDLDSCFGVENSGYLNIPYYADWDYMLGGRYQFNGYSSRLWLMFEQSMANTIQSKAQEITARSANGLNYETLYQYHIADNALLVPPVVINHDMMGKYYEPRVNGFIDYSKSPPSLSRENYMYLYRGSRTMQKDAFIYKRCILLYSRYLCSKFTQERITFRNGTPNGLTAPNTTITVQSNQALIPAIKFGDAGIETQGTLIFPGESCSITMAGTDANRHGTSDTVYICGGRSITSIGDISKWRPYELQLRNAINFKELIIGSEAPGYTGNMTGSLAPAECVLLEKVNVCGVPITSLNLRTNYLIKEVLADNGCTANVTLPNAGFVEKLHLGACSTIEVLNHPRMRDFSIQSLDNLISMRVENTPNIPTLTILQQRLANMTGGVRLIGINETLSDDEPLKALLSADAYGKRIDANGNFVEDETLLPIITGTVNVSTIGTATVRLLREAYPDLIISYQTAYTEYAVTFKNWDGTVLDVQYVPSGGDALDPVASGRIEAAPTRPSDAQYNYTFDTVTRWDLSYTNVTSNISPTAVFIATKRGYQVRWYNKGILLNIADNVEYGSEIVYPGETPIDDSGESEGIYRLFSGWDKSLGSIKGNTDVYAIFTETNLADVKNKSFSEMTPTDVYALIKSGALDASGSNNYYIQCQDTINIMFGKDYNFSNVPSMEPVSVTDPMQFNGTNYYNTGILLWDEDKAWTVVIHFSYQDTTAGQTIASAFDSTGWRITYGSSNPVFRFGASTDVTVGPGQYRDIVVIRRVKGDNNLYFYRSGNQNNEIVFRTISNVNTIRNNAPLSLGAVVTSTGDPSNNATGTIHWCKVWMDDLGDTICRKLVCWPRQTYTFEASGKIVNVNGRQTSVYNNFRNFDPAKPLHLTLLMKNLLDFTKYPNTVASVEGGWPAIDLHTWLILRAGHAFPQQWEDLMIPVYVNSYSGIQDKTIVSSADTVFVPASVEVGGSGTDGDGTFSQFTGNDSRIKRLYNGNGNAAVWTTRSVVINTNNRAMLNTIGTDGHIGGYWNESEVTSTKKGICFGFNI